MANVSLWQLGSYSKNTELIFNNKAGRNSAIADKGVATKVATVDTILCGMAAGYIKADVEGGGYGNPYRYAENNGKLQTKAEFFGIPQI